MHTQLYSLYVGLRQVISVIMKDDNLSDMTSQWEVLESRCETMDVIGSYFYSVMML